MRVLEAQQRKVLMHSRRHRLLLRIARIFTKLSAIDRVHLDDFKYPHYAYGVYLACMQAQMLGQDTTTVIEFGVAGGNGLLSLEDAANEIGASLDVDVDVLGFDAGSGMPPSDDFRDMIYWYRPGAFKMDYSKLKARLRKAKLIIGDIQETVSEATRNLRGPIGFCAFDMDYYSATIQALKVFDASSATRQPRVLIYADDIFGFHDLNVMCESVGEERAFAEFNDSHQVLKIQKVRGLKSKRPLSASWNDKIFALHDFSHEHYNTPINPSSLEMRSRQSSLG